MAKQQLITLTTDFGLTDEFVGVVKGVLLCHAPAATLIDISHSIPPQDVRTGAWMVAASYPYFPDGTIHLVVIDPGVGSSRNILAMQANKHFFVGPDNGVFTLLIQNCLVQQAVLVENKKYFLAGISSTFHGRDIMAPVAGRIAQGLELHEFGRQINPEQCCQLNLPAAVHYQNHILGSLIHIDHFGNMRTSITAQDIAALPSKKNLSIHCCGTTIHSLSDSYSISPEGQLLALIDSRNHLEIAARNGNAAQLTGALIGDEVVITCHP